MGGHEETPLDVFLLSSTYLFVCEEAKDGKFLPIFRLVVESLATVCLEPWRAT